MRVPLLAAAGLIAVASVHPAGQTPHASEAKAAELYKSACLPCHMADGNAALEPMNLADGKWRRGTSVKEIAEVISEGVPGTAMMPFKTRFSEEEILALAHYVRQFDKTLKPETDGKKPASATK